MPGSTRSAPARGSRRRASACWSCALAVALACLVTACVGVGPRDGSPVRVVDLVHDFPRAERRPAGAAFEVAEHTFRATRHATVAVPAPSRLIYLLRFPPRGLF